MIFLSNLAETSCILDYAGKLHAVNSPSYLFVVNKIIYEHCLIEIYSFYIIKWSHCVKSVQIRSFFWPVFSCIRTEYGELRNKSPYSVWKQENPGQKKLRIWAIFMQCLIQKKQCGLEKFRPNCSSNNFKIWV